VLRSGPSVLFKQCIPMPKVGCKLMVSTVKSSMYKSECIRALSSARCCLSWYLKLSLSLGLSLLEEWKNASISSRHGNLPCSQRSSCEHEEDKVPLSGIGLNVLKDSGMFPCSVCRSGVGNNSIECTQCKLWVHKRCSGRLNARPIDGRPVTQVDIDGTLLDINANLCYLSNMLSAGGDCDSVIAVRCCVAWDKFKKLLPVLTTRHLSPRVRGKVYLTCVCSAMLHGSETWGAKCFRSTTT